jgi:hypothetical protein
MLQCKKCYTRLFESNTENEHGELIVICSTCGAKNVLASVLVNKIALSAFEVIGWRE